MSSGAAFSGLFFDLSLNTFQKSRGFELMVEAKIDDLLVDPTETTKADHLSEA